MKTHCLHLHRDLAHPISEQPWHQQASPTPATVAGLHQGLPKCGLAAPRIMTPSKTDPPVHSTSRRSRPRLPSAAGRTDPVARAFWLCALALGVACVLRMPWPRPSVRAEQAGPAAAASETPGSGRGKNRAVGLLHEASRLASMPTPDMQADCAAGLDALAIHGGIRHLLRTGTWCIALADAVEGDPWITEEALSGVLLAAGAHDAAAADLVLGYPVAFDITSGLGGGGSAVELAAAHGRIRRVVEDAFALHGRALPEASETFNALVVECLRCAWLTTHAVGTLHSFADFFATVPDEPGEHGLLDEASDLRREAGEAVRWCAGYFAARFIQRHHVEPAMALDLAMALGAVEEGQLATPSQLFPPRWANP